jgi:hypothetical protein
MGCEQNGMNKEDFSAILSQFDFDKNKKINYSDFLAATIDIN